MRQKSPEIRAAREQARATAAAVAPAAAFDDPMLMVQLWNMPVDLNIPLMVNVTQAIPLGGKRAARRDEAQAMADASRATVTTRVRDVETEVAKAYFDLFLADRPSASTTRSVTRSVRWRPPRPRGWPRDAARSRAVL